MPVGAVKPANEVPAIAVMHSKEYKVYRWLRHGLEELFQRLDRKVCLMIFECRIFLLALLPQFLQVNGCHRSDPCEIRCDDVGSCDDWHSVALLNRYGDAVQLIKE